jgi:competence protein ComFC
MSYQLKRILLSIIYPNRCPFCEAVIDSGEFYCVRCLNLDLYENSNSDTFCCVYNDRSKPLITKAKEEADGYAISAAAKLLHDALAKNNILHRIDTVIAIPPRKTALKQRGYSFPARLAKEVAQLAGKEYNGKLLKLLKETEEQKGLSEAERVANLKGAFGINIPPKERRNVLIIDDVSTTGATLNEARRALTEHTENVYVAAFAKTVI